ncbi:hypothetical protein GIB67_021861 [Kingdonia uniflora]|uniref:Uncharacterized protein n=1 Tax=Kingdonia uniflora TaxID=39325 RepID=A0A7J7NEE0_9MAGN|nr:hypothetical protein GIB67_021861 [Kingdonia uniflora]
MEEMIALVTLVDGTLLYSTRGTNDALPEEEKGALRATCFVPLLLIDPIVTTICSSIKFVKNYTIISPPEQGEKRLVKYVDLVDDLQQFNRFSWVGAPTIGSSSSATEIGAVVVRVCSQLEEHGKMLHNHGKMLERISMSTMRDTPLLGQYQFSTPEKTVKRKREGGNEKEDGKRKKAEPRTKKEGLEVVNDLMVDDNAEVGREVNFNAISFEYGGDLLEMEESKNSDEKVDDVEKNGEEKESEEEQPQVAEEEDLEPPTVVVYYNEKIDEASVDQTTVVSVEEQTIKVVQTEVAISHQEEDVGEASQLVSMESEVDVTLKKRHALTKKEINEKAFKMACQMNQLHAHLDQLLPEVLLESFIHRPIS